MTIKWTEGLIARAISLQTLARKCVVLVDNCNWTGHECDVLAVTTDLRIIDVEVKISRADFKADAKKDKWWHRRFLGWTSDVEYHDERGRLLRVTRDRIESMQLRDWPPKVWKHYYALPEEIWTPDLADAMPSTTSGVLLLRQGRSFGTLKEPQLVVKCIRRACPNKHASRLQPEQVMDIARLANLRMWEAYNQRDHAARQAAA